MFEIKCEKKGDTVYTNIFVDGKRIKRATSLTLSVFGSEEPECWMEILSEDLKNKYKVDLIHREKMK